MYIYSRAMQVLYVPQEAQRQYFNFTLLGPAGIESHKTQDWNWKSKVRDGCYRHQGSQQQNAPTQPSSISNSVLQQLQHSTTTIFCHSGLLLQRNNIFHPPYIILPLGIFPYNTRYFKDRVKATL